MTDDSDENAQLVTEELARAAKQVSVDCPLEWWHEE
jgi:hypothetical protein